MIRSLFLNYRSLSDEQLAERVRLAADERAFAELHRRYARLLQGFFFRRMGGNADQAADLTQDTFLRLWQSLTGTQKSFVHRTFVLRTFVFTISYNLCKNIYRTNGHEQDYLASLPSDEPVAEDNTPLRLDAETFDHALQQELSRLSEAQQMLFELRFTQELSVPEIAAIMAVPEGTVKSRLHTLTQYLRLKLKEYE